MDRGVEEGRQDRRSSTVHRPLIQRPQVYADMPGWVRWVIYALLALGAGVGAVTFPRRCAAAGGPPVVGDRPRTAPPLRQDELGLGADGRRGVWLHQVFPWEQERP